MLVSTSHSGWKGSGTRDMCGRPVSGVHCSSSRPWPLAQSWLVDASSRRGDHSGFQDHLVRLPSWSPPLSEESLASPWLSESFRGSVHPGSSSPGQERPSNQAPTQRKPVSPAAFRVSALMNKCFYSKSMWRVPNVATTSLLPSPGDEI